MNVLGIPGSLRKTSHNRKLLEMAAGCAPPEMEVTVFPADVLASIPPYNGDLEEDLGGDPDPMRRLRDQVRCADGVLISTPEYNQSIPGVLKNHIDWLSRPNPDQVLIGKPVAIMGATTGEWGTRLSQNMLRQVLTSTEALVLPPGAQLYIRNVDQLLEGDELRLSGTMNRLESFLASFAGWIARCAATNPDAFRSSINPRGSRAPRRSA